MKEILNETQQETETAERPFLVRTFAAELTAGDGRTVDVRIVPYGETARVSDRGGPAYEEQWMPGVFAHQTNAANRVLANFEHQSGIAGVVGHGMALREAADGFHGSFRLHETADGDKSLMLVKEGVLDGVSLEAYPVKSVRTAAGVVQRVKANLRAIALCRNPAFASAKVLAVREETVFDEQMLPVVIDPELVERCRRLGIKIPQRYTAHPDDNAGTPGDPGTPEDGTRLQTEPTTLEE
jgi:HK97 family phage prohead protease